MSKGSTSHSHAVIAAVVVVILAILILSFIPVSSFSGGSSKTSQVADITVTVSGTAQAGFATVGNCIASANVNAFASNYHTQTLLSLASIFDVNNMFDFFPTGYTATVTIQGVGTQTFNIVVQNIFGQASFASTTVFHNVAVNQTYSGTVTFSTQPCWLTGLTFPLTFTVTV